MKTTRRIYETVLATLPEENNQYAEHPALPGNISIRMTFNGAYIRASSREFLGCSQEWGFSLAGLRSALKY